MCLIQGHLEYMALAFKVPPPNGENSDSSILGSMSGFLGAFVKEGDPSSSNIPLQMLEIIPIRDSLSISDISELILGP